MVQGFQIQSQGSPLVVQKEALNLEKEDLPKNHFGVSKAREGLS